MFLYLLRFFFLYAFFLFVYWVFSKINAMPWPPPIQADPTAYLPPLRLKKKIWTKHDCYHNQFIYTIRCSNTWRNPSTFEQEYDKYLSSWTKCPVILAPEAPSGWPSAMAPPLTLVFSGSSPKALTTDRYWEANASFTW